MYVYIYMYIYTCMYIYTYIYIYTCIPKMQLRHSYARYCVFFFYMVLRNFRNDVVISDITEESPDVAA